MRWYKDYGGRVFVYDPTTDEIAELRDHKLDRPFVKPLEEVERLVRKGWWHEVDRPYVASETSG